MKKLYFIIVFSLSLLVLCCTTPNEPVEESVPNELAKKNHKATGTVEVAKYDAKGNQTKENMMIADFNAHEEQKKSPAKGIFLFKVLNGKNELHRQITINVSDVKIDETIKKAWFKGIVVDDTKGCSGNGSGSHEGGCSGDDGDHDDGCTGHDTGHDGGCSGEDGTSHDDGGCSGEDGTSHDDGGCSGSGGNGGGKVSGKNCRVGQILVVKVHDVSTPGKNGDGITWKWFDPEDPKVENLDINNVENWPHLCKKTILGGNLVVQ